MPLSTTAKPGAAASVPVAAVAATLCIEVSCRPRRYSDPATATAAAGPAIAILVAGVVGGESPRGGGRRFSTRCGHGSDRDGGGQDRAVAVLAAVFVVATVASAAASVRVGEAVGAARERGGGGSEAASEPRKWRSAHALTCAAAAVGTELPRVAAQVRPLAQYTVERGADATALHFLLPSVYHPFSKCCPVRAWHHTEHGEPLARLC